MPHRSLKYLLIICSCIGYLWFGVTIERTDFLFVLTGFIVLFAMYYLLVKNTGPWKLKEIWIAAIAVRVMLLFAFPNLSDDVYRFVWDGNIILEGINPYEEVPANVFIEDVSERLYLKKEPLELMNSPDYHSVYPPVNQMIYAVSALFAGNHLQANVLWLRIFLLIFELLTFRLLLRILKHFDLAPQHVLWYALNPLVIIEIMGNVHFEGVMVAGLLWGWLALLRHRFLVAGIALAMAFCVKLWPMMFFPFLIKRLGWARALQVFMYCAAFILVLFMPFLSDVLIQNIGGSIDLYFQRFEFNASIYYLVREVGYWMTGYNQIAIIGPMLAGLVLLSAGWLIYRQQGEVKYWMKDVVFMLTIYLLCATTVHPWYVIPLVAVTIFTGYWYALAWSFLVIFSYSAYASADYAEMPALIITEYVLLGVVIVLEVMYKRKAITL